MLVNLTDVFLNEDSKIEKEIALEMKQVSNREGVFDIKEASPVKLTISNIGQAKAYVEGSATVTVGMQCARCLKDVDYTFDIAISEEVISPDHSNYGKDEDESLGFMDGYQLDVDELVNNELLLDWPMKILCKSDCKGICKVCGKNLNDGDCGCDDFVPDPRMAAIKAIFNADKEV